jgi:hypothetical protein
MRPAMPVSRRRRRTLYSTDSVEGVEKGEVEDRGPPHPRQQWFPPREVDEPVVHRH